MTCHNKVCVPNKTYDLNLSVFNKAKHIWRECKCKFDGWKCNWCERRKHLANNGKYLASIIDNSMIKCDEIIDLGTKTVHFDKKNVTCKTRNFYNLLAFLIILLLLITFNIYCYW